MIRLNERDLPFDGPAEAGGITIGALRDRHKPDADVLILNGFPVSGDASVRDGDTVSLIKKGERPSATELEYLMVARHTPGVHEKVRNATVGVCGVGGLGSLVAICLARMGVGALILCDHDVVEPSNLNRQQFRISQIGEPKARALQATLAAINPYVDVSAVEQYLERAAYPEVFDGATVVAECFDNPVCKADVYAVARTAMKDTPFVMVSGIAGYARGDLIRVRRAAPNVVMVGDDTFAAGLGVGLMAPRVAVAAGMQANEVLRAILGVPDDQDMLTT